jgi:hypothetical protein
VANVLGIWGEELVTLDNSHSMDRPSQCAMPGCQQLPSKENRAGRKKWCGEHEGSLCALSSVQAGGRPACSLLTMPNSGWCRTHNDQAIFFDFMHRMRHEQAEQLAQDADKRDRLQPLLGRN